MLHSHRLYCLSQTLGIFAYTVHVLPSLVFDCGIIAKLVQIEMKRRLMISVINVSRGGEGEKSAAQLKRRDVHAAITLLCIEVSIFTFYI